MDLEQLGQITILGKPYEVAKATTFRQDRALELSLKDAGTFEQQDNETEEDLFARVFAHLVDSGDWSKILATRLVPVGQKWTPQLAAVTAFALEEVDDELEKSRITKLIAWTIAAFFAIGAISQSVSRAYSNASLRDAPESNGQKELTIRWACSERWSVRLLDSIRCGWKAFLTVLWTKDAPATSNS